MCTELVSLECERCGETYTRHPSNAEGSRFCSNHCRYDRSNRIPVSEQHSYDDPLWEENRNLALERDGRACQMCDCRENLVVHHVRPLSHGGSHELSNLDTLCSSCHASIHSSGHVITGEVGGGLLLERERELLSQGIPIDLPVDEIIVALRRDVKVLKEHHPDLLEELRDVVCEERDLDE